MQAYEEKWLITEIEMENGYRYTVWSTYGAGYIYKVYPPDGYQIYYSPRSYELVQDATKAARRKIKALQKQAA